MHTFAPVALGPSWMDPQWLLHQYGGAFFWIALIIVFIECGLFFPILPGDSLLFAIGMFSVGSYGFDIPLYVSIPALMVAAFAGNVVGYEIGRKIGPPIYEHDGRIVKRQYFDQTHKFFEKHGNKALVIGRFVPIVRTFITIVAGVTEMDRKKFFTWSGVGAVLWVLLVVGAGVVLGKSFPSLGKNIDYAIVVIVILSVLPMVYEYLKHRRQANQLVEETVDEVRD